MLFTEYKQTQARDRSHQMAATSPQHTHGLTYLNLYLIREISNVKRKHKQNSQVYKSRLLKIRNGTGDVLQQIPCPIILQQGMYYKAKILGSRKWLLDMLTIEDFKNHITAI